MNDRVSATPYAAAEKTAFENDKEKCCRHVSKIIRVAFSLCTWLPRIFEELVILLTGSDGILSLTIVARLSSSAAWA